MTVDIHFGKLARETEDGETWEYANWPDEPAEADGTSLDYTIFSGHPRRSFSNSGFADWVRRIPEAHTITNVCYVDERQATPLDTTLMCLIELLPERGQPIDVDRARWFKYWARRARETFADEAIIFFS